LATAAAKPPYKKEETMRFKTRVLSTLMGTAAIALCVSAGQAQETLKIGVLATLEGPFAAGGQDSMRGADLALKLHNGMAGGKKIEFLKGSSDASPDKAVNATRKLVEQDKVSIMIGPLSGDEGIAVKNYSKTQPDITFINGSSGAQATTLVDPSPNFFRFHTEGAQWMVGLGEHALSKGYKKVFLVAEDYGFPYSQVQGFMAGYCKAGGHVVKKAWVPLGTKDYSSVISTIPGDVDALVVVLGGADAVNFLTQYEQVGGDKPMVGGTITVDQTVLNFKGKRRESLLGTPSAGPMADSIDTPEWKKFVADYKANFKDGFPSPSLFAFLYYLSTEAALEGLDAVKGDLSGGQKAYREALQKLVLHGPAGDIRIDENRNGIGDTYITEVAKKPDGEFYNQVVKVTHNVTETLGLSKDEFNKMGLGSRDVPNCP
jgi:branched-chain amino acid transport system substrate-binding protein